MDIQRNIDECSRFPRSKVIISMLGAYSHRVRHRYAGNLIEHVQERLDWFCRSAIGMRSAPIGAAGVLSSSASGWFARTALARSDVRDLWVRLLRSRFAEIIVDEAPDCGADKLSVLEVSALAE